MAIYTVSLLFSSTKILEKCLEQYQATRAIQNAHFVLDDHYPLNRNENERHLAQLQERYSLNVIDSGHNRGLHKGFNYLLSQMPLQADDTIIVLDPDCFPITRGWDYALVDVLSAHSNLAYVGLRSPVTFEDASAVWTKLNRLDSARALVPNRPHQLNISAWKVAFIRAVGGWQEPTNFYGHLETAMWQKVQEQKKQIAYLPDYEEDFRLCAMHDTVYNEYKWAHAHHFTFSGSFTEYVAARGLT